MQKTAQSSSMMGAVLLFLYLLLSIVIATSDDTFVIDHKTNLHDVFECSRVHAIGFFNEFYVTCAFHPGKHTNASKLEVHNTTVRGADLAPFDDVHVELQFSTKPMLAEVHVQSSIIEASAVEIIATSISIDKSSTVNTSMQGLKFGPGYDSWDHTGGSYGGIGGASLQFLRDTCDQIGKNTMFRDIGTIAGDLSNFRGYGSGGGDVCCRGGGRVKIQASKALQLDGKLLAVGSDANAGGDGSGGSGGLVLVVAKETLSGSGVIQVNGGNPAAYEKKGDKGGGGGGGGGRISIRTSDENQLKNISMEAFGGGKFTGKSSATQWCQLGADGTVFLEYNVSTTASEDGKSQVAGHILIAGARLDATAPSRSVSLYGCTPIFEFTSRYDPFLPSSTASVVVSGGASVCIDSIKLQPFTSSTLSLQSGSALNGMARTSRMSIHANKVSIQGFVGPSTQETNDLFDIHFQSDSVSISNALVVGDSIDISTTGTFELDQYSVIKFQTHMLVDAKKDVKMQGSLQPLPSQDEDKSTVDIRSSSGNVQFLPLFIGLEAIYISITSGAKADVELPFDAPLAHLAVSAQDVQLVRANSRLTRTCAASAYQADPSACSILRHEPPQSSPFIIGVFANKSATVENVTAGSILLCGSDQLSIENLITSDALGCPPDQGPGKSDSTDSASGGAGHGGRGGNIQPDGQGAGKAYDASSGWWGGHQWPQWPGSGASGGDDPSGVWGGSGGGMIHLASPKLEIKGNVSAKGGSGAKGGGGGSGGSIFISTADVSGSGLVDVSGGHASNAGAVEFTTTSVWEVDATLIRHVAGTSFGGGGGGGVLRIDYLGFNNTANNAETFLKNGGKLLASGGKSNGGEGGQDGVTIGSNCFSGRGGVACQPCNEGTYSPHNSSTCVPCDPGSFTDKKGSNMCNKCAPGHFNKDFGKASCSACGAGTFAKDNGATQCAPCTPGSFAPGEASSICAECPIGSISTTFGNTNCSVCRVGHTTAKRGSTVCEECHVKPDHAYFNVPGNCTYACEKGRTGLDCLTPFERLLKPIGGVFGFLLIVAGAVSMVFATWGFVRYRASRHIATRFEQYKKQMKRDEQSLTSLTRNLTPRLTDHDLETHLVRLYLGGENRVQSPWVVNSTFLPLPLRDLVFEGAFSAFADKCNALLKWKNNWWETSLYRVLYCLLPPVGVLFMRHRQLRRVEKLTRFVAQYRGGFFREINFRVHSAHLKVGFSPDFSLAYFDVLVAPRTHSSTGSAPSSGSIDTPDLILVVAGSGSFFRPYHLDTNDVLVRAVPRQLHLLDHDSWLAFVADANELLWRVPQPSSPSRRDKAAMDIASMVDIVSEFSERHSHDGLEVTFGTFWVSSAAYADSNANCFVPWETERSSEVLSQYNEDQFKLAFRITRQWGTPSSAMEESKRDDHVLSNDEPERHLSSDLRFSSIRRESLFAEEYAAKSKPLSPTKDKEGHRRTSRSSSIGAWMENSHLPSWLQSLEEFAGPVFRLRHVRAKEFRMQWMLGTFMILLLMLDLALVFWVFVEYFCVQVQDPTSHDSGCSRAALWSVNLFLPGGLVGAPILGLAAVAKKSLFYGKLFVVWDVASAVNFIVAFACGLIYQRYIHATIIFISIGGLLIKYALKVTALQCLAHYTKERPLPGWRGLYTTEDWYDAAYTPLLHQEK